jgi:hypothetical protein
MLRDVATFDVYVMGFITMPLAASRQPEAAVHAPSVTVAVILEEHTVPVTEPFAQYVKVVGAPK